VKTLSRVNLIVGKNNAGKSSFLEAIELYASNASQLTIIRLIESRQETWISEGQFFPMSLSGNPNPVRHLFYNHRLPSLDKPGIILGEIEASPKLHITVAGYTITSQPNGASTRTRLTKLNPEDDFGEVELNLIAQEGDKARRIFNLSYINLNDIKSRYSSNYHEGIAGEYKCPWQVVHTGNIPGKTIAGLWDLISLTELESEVIGALKLIESRVTGVAFVEDSNLKGSKDNRIPIVKIDGIKEPLPLKSMGDGMTRLFHIIVALVNAQNGILLVDEFENGLYWKVQPKVWDVVFQLADRLNVQVFATTHSRDCIRAFDEAWNKYPQSGAFFRLDARPEGVKITEYNAETLTDAIETDVEVR
jgi:hypothetical protein